MRRTTVKIPDDLDDRLRKEAARRDMTVSAVVREALEAHLLPGKRRRLRSAGIIAIDRADMSTAAREMLAEMFTEPEDGKPGEPSP